MCYNMMSYWLVTSSNIIVRLFQKSSASIMHLRVNGKYKASTRPGTISTNGAPVVCPHSFRRACYSNMDSLTASRVTISPRASTSFIPGAVRNWQTVGKVQKRKMSKMFRSIQDRDAKQASTQIRQLNKDIRYQNSVSLTQLITINIAHALPLFFPSGLKVYRINGGMLSVWNDPSITKR